MQPAVAERGLMVIDAEVIGVAGHAARNEGLNAIYLALKDIESIESLRFHDPSEWLPDPCAQVTMISGGHKHNVVPDRCTYVVDVRSNDMYGNERILDMLKECCQASLHPRSTRLRASRLNRDHFLMDAVNTLGLKPFGSSTLSDMALIPFPSIKMGPGESARSHTAEEFVETGELAHGVAVYQEFLAAVESARRKQGNQHLKDKFAEREQ
jgi:acetylornithine deacetylase